MNTVIKASPYSTNYKYNFYSIFNYRYTCQGNYNLASPQRYSLSHSLLLVLSALYYLLIHDISIYLYQLLYEIEYRCGNISEIVHYDYMPRVATNRRNRGIRGKGKDKNKNKIDSNRRKKQRIRRIITANASGRDSFLTVTCAKNIKEEAVAKNLLSNFLERLQYQYQGFDNYLWAAERQGRGSIHFHIIFFNCPYIKHQHLKTIWGHGTVRIKKTEDKDCLGNYFCSYLSKDNTIKGRSWGHSETLKTYEVFKRIAHSEIPEEDILYAPEPYETKYHGMRRVIFTRNTGSCSRQIADIPTALERSRNNA